MKTLNRKKTIIYLTAISLILLFLSGCARDMALSYALYAKQNDEKGLHDETIRSAKQSTQYSPYYAPGWYWLGIGNYRKGNYDEAIPAFKKVLELKPTGPQYQSSYDYLGWAYYNKADYREAVNYFAKSLELSPKDGSSLSGAGWSYYWLADYDSALKYFNKIMEITVNDDVMMARAWAYFSKGMINEAYADAEKAISLNPQKEGGYRIKGWVQYFRGNYQEAIRELNSSMEKITNDKWASMARQHALRGKAFSYLGLGDGETAKNLVKAAHESLNYDLNHDLSLLYYVLGEKEKAWEYRGGSGMVGLEVKNYEKAGIKGAGVVKIMTGGPAEKTNILSGDVIIKLNDSEIAGVEDFVKRAKILTPGMTAKLEILREGAKKHVNFVVASAESLIENDRLIAPVMAKKKGKSEVATYAPAQETSSKPSVSDKLPPLRQDAYALIIGIDYKGKHDIPGLQYAASDAQNVYDVLTDARYGGVPKENALLLLNDKATRNAIKSALRKIKNESGYIYIYFSGHGAPKTKGDKFIDAFLVPYDADITSIDAIDDTGIRLSEIEKLMEESPAKGVMVALDACFTGGGKSVVPKGGKPLVGMLVTTELASLKGSGKIMLTSSAANQQSWEDEKEIKGGIFSHYLLKGLRGDADADADSWINVGELAKYIKENVVRTAKKLKGEDQTPQLIGSGNFAVTRNWERAKVMDTDIAKAKLKSAFEKGDITAEQLSKAMDELKSSKRSKTLEAFLGGKIDERKFGELY